MRRHVCVSGAWPGDWQHATLNPCIDKTVAEVQMYACMAAVDYSSYSDEAIAEEGRKIEARRSREGLTSR